MLVLMLQNKAVTMKMAVITAELRAARPVSKTACHGTAKRL
jgi:hypothetical protein